MFSQAYDWVYPSTVLISYLKGSLVVGSGTGFFLRGLLVTNAHVMRTPDGCDVRFMLPHREKTVLTSDKVFYDSCLGASEKQKFDYAFFDPAFLPKDWSTTTNRLSTPHARVPQVGDEVGIIGYPFGKPRATGHRCWITSIYRSSGVSVFQLEGSINASNSGGPLFSTHESAILGIVTRKESGLSERFELLKTRLSDRQRNLQENEGLEKNIDPLVSSTLADMHTDMIQLAKELERSSNTGIGYAFSIEHLLDEPKFTTNAMEDPQGPPLRYWPPSPSQGQG